MNAGLDYCYLTTTGRVTGRAHEIEIWFALEGRTVYLLSGGAGRSDWVKNLRKTPEVSVRIGETTYRGQARVVESGDEDERARALLVEKYQPRYSGDLQDWRKRGLPVAIDLSEARRASTPGRDPRARTTRGRRSARPPTA